MCIKTVVGRKTGFQLSCITLALAANLAHAQEQEGVIRTESGIDFIPSLQAELKHDDNVVRDKDATVSSWISTLAPTLRANLVDGPNSYSFAAAVKNAVYFDSSADNFTDGYLDAEAKLSPASAHNLKLKANNSWLHEDRGTGVSEGRGNLQSEETRFNAQTLQAEYEYGSSGSIGKLRANTRFYNKDYKNFRDLTQYRDYDSLQLGGGFVYQTPGAFKLVAELSTAEIDFKTDDLSGSRDNTDNNYRLGAEWDITALTTGILKLGYQNKDFDLAVREKFTGFSWEAIVQWLPLTYSGFDFSTGRRAKDVDALNINSDYIIETTYSIGWNHQWSEQLSSKLSYEYQTDEYNRVVRLGTTLGREDTRKIITAELESKPLRWLTLTGFVNLEDRTSTLGVIVYDRTVYGLNVQMTL
ncbi:MAG: hypothetical protein E6Q75_02675 [Rheinheimera sp.]|nr:MAG: hypothetical protein E6Q75_02675 [Rheinheimera sp.]